MSTTFLFSVFLALSIGTSTTAQASFLPDSVLEAAAPAEGSSNITEEEFRSIVQRIQSGFEANVKSHGGNLQVSGDWKSETLNAGASQMFGAWKVVITGALARRPELTPDGFSLILCHELGHHLGGFSFAPGQTPFQGVWAANEGQSDYFATQVCARKLWASEREKNATFRGKVSDFVRERCDTAWTTVEDQDLCYRVSAGAKSVGDTMAAILKQPAPAFETPDPGVADKTNDGHPAVQCRLDTSFQGAICPVTFNDTHIPGKKANGGPFSIEAEREGAVSSCTNYSRQVFGLRPVCWFKARL